MSERNTGVNALVGGVVAILAAPLFPLSPVLGGAVAGYLEGGSTRDGVVVGAAVGVIALLPLLLGFSLFGGLFLIGPLGMGMWMEMGVPGGFTALSAVFLVFGLVFFSAYLVGFAALGGAVGAYVATEIGRRPDR